MIFLKIDLRCLSSRVQGIVNVIFCVTMSQDFCLRGHWSFHLLNKVDISTIDCLRLNDGHLMAVLKSPISVWLKGIHICAHLIFVNETFRGFVLQVYALETQINFIHCVIFKYEISQNTLVTSLSFLRHYHEM